MPGVPGDNGIEIGVPVAPPQAAVAPAVIATVVKDVAQTAVAADEPDVETQAPTTEAGVPDAQIQIANPSVSTEKEMNDKEEKKKKPAQVSVSKLFSYADNTDMLLIAIGTIAAGVHSV